MYDKKEYLKLDIDNVIDEIEANGLSTLKKGFKDLGLSIFDINNLSRELKKIKITPSLKKKELLIKAFLLGHYQHYSKKSSTPLNSFSLYCGKVFSQYFLKNE